jgi:hypothetical protein
VAPYPRMLRRSARSVVGLWDRLAPTSGGGAAHARRDANTRVNSHDGPPPRLAGMRLMTLFHTLGPLIGDRRYVARTLEWTGFDGEPLRTTVVLPV